eukprot:XP_016878294.1 uncharacterized protein LOC105370733 isoform X1 [Homo sapiens]
MTQDLVLAVPFMGCLLILVDGLKPNRPAYIQILWHLRVALCIRSFNGANGQPGNQSMDKGKEASVEEVLQAPSSSIWVVLPICYMSVDHYVCLKLFSKTLLKTMTHCGEKGGKTVTTQHGDALTPFFNPEDGPSTHKSTRPGTSCKVPMDHLARLYRKHSDFCFWEDLRKFPIMVEGKGGASTSHSQSRMKRGAGVLRTFKQPDLVRTHSLSGEQHQWC